MWEQIDDELIKGASLIEILTSCSYLMGERKVWKCDREAWTRIAFRLIVRVREVTLSKQIESTSLQLNLIKSLTQGLPFPSNNF